MTVTRVARRDVVVAGLVLGSIWAVGAVTPLGVVNRSDFMRVVSAYVLTAMLGSYVAVAWLATRLAPGRAGVRAFAWVLAISGLIGASGNFLEDVVRIPGAEYIYGFGFFGTFFGFVGLALALAGARRFWPALAVAATFAGVIVMAGNGPPVVPILWFGIVVWTLLSGRAGGDQLVDSRTTRIG